MTAESVSDETSGDVQLTRLRDRTACRRLLVDWISYRCHTCAQSQCELPLCTTEASIAGIMSVWVWWRIHYRLYDLATFDPPYLCLQLSVLCWARCQFVAVDHQCGHLKVQYVGIIVENIDSTTNIHKMRITLLMWWHLCKKVSMPTSSPGACVHLKLLC